MLTDIFWKLLISGCILFLVKNVFKSTEKTLLKSSRNCLYCLYIKNSQEPVLGHHWVILETIYEVFSRTILNDKNRLRTFQSQKQRKSMNNQSQKKFTCFFMKNERIVFFKWYHGKYLKNVMEITIFYEKHYESLIQTNFYSFHLIWH